jgi:ATP-dependent Lon protease
MTLLAAPPTRTSEMPTIALADLPYDKRCHLFDKKAPWRLPLLRRLAPQAAAASAADQMPWVDIPAWLDVVQVVADYKDGLDLATKRDLIVRDIPKSGFQRRLAPPPDPALVEALVEEFPNFQPVIEHTADQLAIAALGNGRLRLPAMLLLGEPGIGKSVFADSLATALGVRTRTVSLSHATQGGALGGLAAYWGTGATGEVFNALLRGKELNPVFILDEIDKATGTTEGRYNPLGPLYSLLEPEDAKQFTDEYAGVPIDSSWFSWVATANDLHVLPAPIASRLAVFEIRSPTRSELRQIGHRQYRRLVDGFGLAGHLPAEAPATLLDQVEISPRELRVLIQSAIGRMARDCLAGKELRVITMPPAPAHRRGMGFV